MSPHMPNEQDLVAYVDGELSPGERARVEAAMAIDTRVAARVFALSQTTIGLRKAFEPLLSAAPVARMLESMGQPPVASAPAQMNYPRKLSRVGRQWMIAANVALFALGGLVDHLALSPTPITIEQGTGHWRDIVASYVRLYTPQTLANAPNDPALRARELATVGRAIGLRLDPATVRLADIPMKQAQILQYDEMPLAEISYLDPQYGPLTLCIMRSIEPAAAPKSEIRHELNVSYWNDGYHAFMIIGAQPASKLVAIAGTLTGRFKKLLDWQHDHGRDVKL